MKRIHSYSLDSIIWIAWLRFIGAAVGGDLGTVLRS
jgi:hypothetical protein